MKKRIILCSIIAVVMLTLVSFSSVVGYNSYKSDIKTNSPLFSIRNNKGDVSSNSIGKGKDINILLPTRTDETNLILNVLDVIIKMDDETFEKFIILINNHLKNNDAFIDVDIDEIINQFRHIRLYPEQLKSFLINNNFGELSTDDYPTYDVWYPGCIIFNIFIFIVSSIIIIVAVKMMSIYFILYGIAQMFTIIFPYTFFCTLSVHC